MKSTLTLSFLLAVAFYGQAQDPFPFGRVTLAEMDMTSYDRDTTAEAVVLNEFGEAYFSTEGDLDLVFEYHAKIKILKRSAFERANFEVLLPKNDGQTTKWISVQGSTFNLNGQSLVETKLDPKKVFKETRSEYLDIMKFTLPDIRVGSVIEVKYRIESPFKFNFHEWKFQSDIPKVRSEFWAKIPGNYQYNITLRGFLNLTKNESEIIKGCFNVGVNAIADCAFYRYAIDNVPALKSEEFMTARSNFLSALNYELIQVTSFDGRVYKYTKEWRDVEEELRGHADFGAQIRKAKNLFDDQLPALLAGAADEKEKAVRIYHYVSSTFEWDEYYGKYASKGIRKAYAEKKGNIGDINLTLVAILQEAGLEADPVLLSTREVGLPNTLYPVMSDFNYVVARVKVNDQFYLVDASDPFLPFGVLPERCLNGKGRLITRNGADWVDLTPKAKEKSQTVMTLKLEDDGYIRGTVEIKSFDYEAADKRKAILSHESEAEYIKSAAAAWVNAEISNYKVDDLKDPEKVLIERMDIAIKAFDDLNAKVLFLDPFFMGKWNTNPFKSNERSFPVDFGAPLETLLVLSMEYPAQFTIDELPTNAALALPNAGGRFLFSVTNPGGRISLTSNLQVNKPIYTPSEYPALRELFNRVIASQQSIIALKRKE